MFEFDVRLFPHEALALTTCFSYSPASDYLQYASAIPIFRDICGASPEPSAITALKELDPEMTCSLNYAADMLKLLIDGLIKRVQPIVGNVTHVVRETWVSVDSDPGVQISIPKRD
jgi:hypothetical protein